MGVAVQSNEYTRYVICKEMGWDYYTFEAQPPFFIDEILIFMKQENIKNNQEMKKHG